ncbi:MAG: glycerate kinase [Bacteroidota bacterium]
MNVIIAPDKFKGSLTAHDVCQAVARGVRAVHPDANLHLIPLADGGEGSLEVLVSTQRMTYMTETVVDPLSRPVQARYARKDDSAYVEMALASGLELLSPPERSASTTSSIGTGQLMRHAIDSGCKHIYLFVGGSATNDGGMGMAHGLGYKFLDAKGIELSPVGENLGNVSTIVEPQSLGPFSLTLVTDVQNKLLGPEGATHKYGPQKGATPQELDQLEAGMSHYAELITERTGSAIAPTLGSGAAGGIAVSAIGLLGGEVKGGIATILEATDFHQLLPQTELVITGEGKIDSQTLQGKVVHGVAQITKQARVRTIAVCGVNELGKEEEGSLGLERVLALKNPSLSVDYCLSHAADLITERTTDYLEARRP